MARMALRVDFKSAPAPVLKQLFGEAKHSKLIVESLSHFEGQAHEQEVFHYLNTDTAGNFVLVQGTNGPTVAVSMQNLRNQLKTMVLTGQIKRFGGERSARYALNEFEGVMDEEDEGEVEEETVDAE